MAHRITRNGSSPIGEMMKKILVASLVGLFASTAYAQVSPDGTILMRGATGTIVTSEGTWSFGPGNVMLNGVAIGGANTMELEVGGDGLLYGFNPPASWYAHANGAWAANAIPAPPPIVSSPPSSSGGVQSLTLTQNSAGSLACPNGACSLTIPQPQPGPPGAFYGGTLVVPTDRAVGAIAATDNTMVLLDINSGIDNFPLPAASSVPQDFAFCFKAQNGTMTFTGGPGSLMAPDQSAFGPGSDKCIGIDGHGNWYVM